MDPRTIEAVATEILAAYLRTGNDTTPMDWVTAMYQAEDELAGRPRRIVLIELPAEEPPEPEAEKVDLGDGTFAEVVANPEPSSPSDLYFVTVRKGDEVLESYTAEHPTATFR